MSVSRSVEPEVGAPPKVWDGTEEPPPRLSGSLPLGVSSDGAGCSSTRRRSDHTVSSGQRPKLTPSTFGASARFAGLNDVQQAAAAHEPLHLSALSLGRTVARAASFSKAPRQSPFPAAVDGRGASDDAGLGPGAYYHERSRDADVTRSRAPALSMGSAPRSTPILLLKSGFYVSLSSAEKSVGTTPTTSPATSRRPSSSPCRVPRQGAPPDTLVRLQSPRAIMPTARRFLDSSTDVPGPGAYLPLSLSEDARTKGRCASAPVARRGDRSPPGAPRGVEGAAEANPRRESSRAPNRACASCVATHEARSGVGRPVFCPIDPDVPGPGAYRVAGIDTPPLRRTTSLRGSLSFAKRSACDPVVKEEATGVAESTLLVPAVGAAKAAPEVTEPVIVGSTFLRRSSNVFLRKSQDQWVQRSLAPSQLRSSRCSSRSATVSREGSLSLTHATSLHGTERGADTTTAAAVAVTSDTNIPR